jgi:ABC-type uncharacterized transport system substrate-binding protein
MIDSLKRLALGLVLIALAGATLLLSDQSSRKKTASLIGMMPEKVFQIAIVQHASIPALDDGVAGIVEALSSRGYVNGGKIRIKFFNAQSDAGTATAIAKQVTSGDFDLIVSASTPSLQSVANANKSGAMTPHVFGLVTDPYSAGVGIDPNDHWKHPPYMTGAGCMQPVAEAFEIAKVMLPSLSSVGLVWNPSEANSQAQTKLARAECQKLGIQLVEAPIETSNSALEATASLILKNVQAIWLSGDVTVGAANASIIATAKRSGIPVFTSQPPAIKFGSLFDMGADYIQAGRLTGQIAADVLDGKSPADIPVENLVPVQFFYNETTLAGLKDPWSIPASLRAKANGWITATETHIPQGIPKAPMPTPAPEKNYSIGIIAFGPEKEAEECIRGILDGLRNHGLEEGKNLTVRRAHAQGEISNIPALLQNFDSSDVDLIVPMSTPVISAACNFVKKKPIVFTYCSDPIAAGAGQSFTNHLPNVTGVGSFPPVMDMVDLIRTTMPNAKTIGTIYNTAEANSVKVVGVARELFPKSGLALSEATVSSSAEVLQAAQALASRGVDAIYVQGDNTVAQGFPALVRIASDFRIPLFTDNPEPSQDGAVACVGVGFYQPGYAIAEMVARVLHGTPPSEIPIENVSEKIEWINRPIAKSLGLTIPESLPDAPKPSNKP